MVIKHFVASTYGCELENEVQYHAYQTNLAFMHPYHNLSDLNDCKGEKICIMLWSDFYCYITGCRTGEKIHFTLSKEMEEEQFGFFCHNLLHNVRTTVFWKEVMKKSDDGYIISCTAPGILRQMSELLYD